jgi:uncharacterized protein (DUF2267 family)
MEHREDGLMVDFSPDLVNTGRRQTVYNPSQEKELATLDQETRLMRAMNEIRDYTPKSMTTAERAVFNLMCEKIFAKHGITPETYSQYANLGTRDQLRK